MAVDVADIASLIDLTEKTVESLTRLRDRIIEAHKNYSVAKTVGSGVGIVGGVASILGLGLAPVTFGSSAALTAGGLACSIGAAAVSVTTSIIETIKENGWAEELIEALNERTKELLRIGEKIEQFPSTEDYVKLGLKTGWNGVTKSLAAARLCKYLKIMAPDYGASGASLIALPKWVLEEINLFGAAARQSHQATFGLPGTAFLNENAWLTKNLRKVFKVDTTKIGVNGLRVLGGALSIAGIGLDIYTIVATWTTEPESVKQIDKLLEYLQGTLPQLKELLKEMENSAVQNQNSLANTCPIL